MLARMLAVVAAIFLMAGSASAQAPTGGAAAPAAGTAGAWRPPGAVSTARVLPDDGTPPRAAAPASASPAATARQPIARVTKGPGSLPNEAGQEWRDYDISPYTLRVTTTNRPEQALVDWILAETGYEAWHGEPLGVLSASRRTLRVYHTPEMHAVVAEMVDRFVNSEADSQAFGIRIVTVGSPNWRAKSQRMLKPVKAQSQGVQAWLLAKEDSSLLSADLRKRSDFREHNSPHLLVNNGQSTIVTDIRPRNYVHDVVLGGPWPGFQPQMAQIDEGYSLELKPLLSLDGRTIDAIIKCNVDQVEKMLPVMLDVPTTAAPRQRTKIEVPQITTCRLHERFRWPADQVLLISLGVVASPVPPPSGASKVTLPMMNDPTRTELLVFVENKGKSGAPPSALRPEQREANNYRGRY